MENKILPALLICVAITSIPSKATAETFSKQHQAVAQVFRSNEEKSAKDAVWTLSNYFKVGVFDNGLNRDGYASYVCNVLYDYGFKGKGINVHIIDIVKLKQTQEWVKLGKAVCL